MVFFDPNNPRDAEGRVHHLHVKRGEVANRILSVGDMGRADRIAHQLDNYGTTGAGAPIKVVAPRGFVTYTGTYKGVQVTILATGMGVPMMDFSVRETRACVEGPMAMLRYGTCGGLRDTPPGAVVSASGTVLVRRDGDAVAAHMAAEAAIAAARAAGAEPAAADVATMAAVPYTVSSVVLPDPEMARLFRTCLESSIAARFGTTHTVYDGITASADSFYSSQGRLTGLFHDYNEKVIDALEGAAGLEGLRALEMETHHLLDLARCSLPSGKIYAAGAAMVLANRHTNEALPKRRLEELEEVGGHAGLEALIAFEFPEDAATAAAK